MFAVSVKISFLLVCCLSSIIFVQAIKKWPSYLPRCYRDDPDANKCLLELTDKLKPFLKKGIPEFGFPSMSPFRLPEVSVQHEGAIASYKAIFINPTFTGLESYKFHKIDFDSKNFSMHAVFTIDLVELFTDFVLKGKLLSIPIQGNGTAKLGSKNATGILRVKVTVITKKGVDYLQVDKFDISVHFGEIVDFDFDIPLHKNELMAEIIDNILKENKLELVEELRPKAEKALGDVLKTIFNIYISRVPYDEMFPLHKN